MKISILTPSFNQGNFIGENILSVLNQGYANFEHIIIDGGSNDNTIEILKNYPHLKWISEHDNGQSDALQKGIKIATGDIIGWINSDDYYLPGAFLDVINKFSETNARWIIGNIKIKYENSGRFIPIKTKQINYKTLSKNPDLVKQPAAFYKKNLILESGGFNDRFYMVMDYDLWYRMSKLSTPLMADNFYAVFRQHLNQKTSVKNCLLQLKELKLISKEEGLRRMYVYKVFKTYKFILRYILKKSLLFLGVIKTYNL